MEERIFKDAQDVLSFRLTNMKHVLTTFFLNRFRHPLYLVLLLLMTCIHVTGQEKNNQTLVYISGGGASSTFNDPTFSSLTLKGNSGIGGVGVDFYTKKSLHQVWMGGSTGSLTWPISEPHSYNTVRANYHYLRTIAGQYDQFSLAVGTGIAFLYQEREYTGLLNNDMNAEFLVSLNLAVSGYYSPEETSFHFSYGIYGSALSLAAQPLYGGYAWQVPAEDPLSKQSMLRAASIKGPGSVFRIRNRFDASYDISNRITVGIAYSAEYAKMVINRNVQWNSHDLQISLGIKL